MKKFLITKVNSTDEFYDADVKYFVLELNEFNLAALRVGKSAFKDIQELGARSVCFYGLGQFLQQDILGPRFDNTKFKEIRGTKLYPDIWISNSADIQYYLDTFGISADATVYYGTEFLVKFTPKHFSGEVESELISYSVLES
jgi:hypothetical protein